MLDTPSSTHHSRVSEPSGLRALIDATAAAASLGGILAIAALVTVIVGEATHGVDFPLTSTAGLAGYAVFTAACLLVVGIVGVAIRFAPVLSTTGRVAIVALTLAAAVTVAAEGTFALVLPDLVVRLPEITENPPAAIQTAFLTGRLGVGIGGTLLALTLRRSRLVPTASWIVLLVASVVALLPLPSSFFLFALAIGAVLWASRKPSR